MSDTGDTGEKSKPDKADLLKPLGVRKVRFKAAKFLATETGGALAQHFFSQKQVQFLETYGDTLDIKTACEKSGLKPHHVRKSEYLMREIGHINEAAQFKHRGKAALGSFYKFMQKVEDEFEKPLASAEMKKAAMATLARMHDTALKVAGEFSEKVDSTGVSGVRVVINIGPPPEVPGAAIVQGEVVDVE